MRLIGDPGRTCFEKILYVEVIDPSTGLGEILVYCRQRNLCLASWAAAPVLRVLPWVGPGYLWL